MRVKYKNRDYQFTVKEANVPPHIMKCYQTALYSKGFCEQYMQAKDEEEFFDLIQDHDGKTLNKLNIVHKKKRQQALESLENHLVEALDYWEGENESFITADLAGMDSEIRVVMKILREFIAGNFGEFIPGEALDATDADEGATEGEESEEVEGKSGQESDQALSDDFIEAYQGDLIAALSVYYLLQYMEMDDETQSRFDPIRTKLSLFVQCAFAGFQIETGRIESSTLEERIEILEKEISSKDKVIEDKKKTISTHTADLENVRKQLKAVEKKFKDDAVDQLGLENKQLHVEVVQLNATIGKLKAETVPKMDYVRIQDAYDVLQSEFGKRGAEISRLRAQVESQGTKDLAEKLEAYLKMNGLTDELMMVIHPYYQDYQDGKKPIKHQMAEGISRMMGWCKLKGSSHYFKGITGEEKKIFNIPDECLLAENQFVVVDPDMNFIFSAEYRFEESEMDRGIRRFEVLSKDTLNTYRNLRDFDLREGQVAAIGSDDEILRIYKHIRFNADHYLQSALLRGQSVYLVQKIIAEGMMVTEIHSSVEKFLILEEQPKDLSAYSILFVKAGKVVKMLDNPRFYTASELYKDKEFGPVEMIEERFYFTRRNRERVLVRLIPEDLRLHDGDVILIDGFNNLVEYKKIVENIEISEARRRLEYRDCISAEGEDDEDAPLPELAKEQVLIIGDPKLSTSYKLAFLKEGYIAETVDGCDVWFKIAKAAGAADYIVYVTDYATHAWCYKLKEEFAHKKIIYADHGGANRVVETVRGEIGLKSA